MSLSEWENKSNYYKMLELGSDIKTQTQNLSRQTKDMYKQLSDSANSIVTSQERSSEIISQSIDNVKNGLNGLQSAFEWGISDVVWQIEQNRKILKDVLETLMTPLDTQAKERRKRAENAYFNGWIDDAEEEFLESEKLNKFDFAIHINLGIIYLFHKNNEKKSLKYFNKAIKYSKPESKYHTSFALLFKARILFNNDYIDEAEKNSALAIKYAPEMTEAYYQNSQYNAQLKNVKKCLKYLYHIIKKDKYYCLKIDNDKLFDPIRSHVNKLIIKLCDEVSEEVISIVNKCKSLINSINNVVKEFDIPSKYRQISINNFDYEIKEIQSLLDKKSYFDALYAKSKSVDFQLNIKEYSEKIDSDLSDIIYKISREQRDDVAQTDDIIDKTQEYTIYSINIIHIVLHFFLYIYLIVNDSIGWVFYIVPLIFWLLIIYGLSILLSKIIGWIMKSYFDIQKQSYHHSIEQNLKKYEQYQKQLSYIIEGNKNLFVLC